MRNGQQWRLTVAAEVVFPRHALSAALSASVAACVSVCWTSNEHRPAGIRPQLLANDQAHEFERRATGQIFPNDDDGRQ